MKLLIAEDDTGIVSFLQQGLEEEGFTVRVCENGLDAIERTSKESFDLLLLDWMLPGASGIDICRAVREHNTEVPIIMLTAKDTTNEVVYGLQSGANDYIKKPFHFEELLERIRVQLRSQMEEPTVWELGDIAIDTEKYRVSKKGATVSLTQREYELLLYLLKNMEVVCTRHQIIRDVWDIHFEYDTGVIDVYINALRKKLGLSNNELIKTVRGVGYIASERT